MATIPLQAADKLEPDSREAINAKFAEHDTALANKLDKAGGTMTGDVNMNNKKITNLPAPVSSGEPARKAELDAYVPPDNSITPTKISHDNPRTKVYFTFQWTTGTTPSYCYKIGSIVTTASIGHPMHRPGCITGIRVAKGGNSYGSSYAYSTTGSRHFNTGDKLNAIFLSGEHHVQKNGAVTNAYVADQGEGNVDTIMEVEAELDN